MSITDILHYLTLPQLLNGLLVAVKITLGSLVLSYVLGVLVALGGQSKSVTIRSFFAFYVWLIRGVPELLQLIFMYNFLPLIGIRISPMLTAIVALGIADAAFSGEIMRSGLRGVRREQIEAATSLGMRPDQVFLRVRVPQALRISAPALAGQLTLLLKVTSLASVIAVPELTLKSQQIIAVNFDYISVFAAAAILYLSATSLITIVQRFIEWKLDYARHDARRRYRALDKVGSTRVELDAWSRGRSDDSWMGRNQTTSTTSPEDGPLLEVHDVTMRYGSKVVLDNVSLAVERSEVVCLIGPSGTGKSTLIRLATGLEEPASGSVTLAGVSLASRHFNRLVPISVRHWLRELELARKRKRARIATVFQMFNLFEHRTVLQNLVEAPVHVHGEDRGRIEKVSRSLLTAMGLDEVADVHPATLSGGQQQRAAIARAFILEPNIVLLDEPTSALDPELTSEVLRSIQALADAGLTLVIVTHEIEFARACATRIVFLDEGQIAEDGPPEQVLGSTRSERVTKFLGSMGTGAAREFEGTDGSRSTDSGVTVLDVTDA